MIRKNLLALALAAFLLAPAATPAWAQDTGLAPPPRAPTSTSAKLGPARNAAGNLVFYRRVSNWELKQIKSRNGLFVTPGSGESFVSTSREYVDQLGARHPKDYANLVVIEVSPEAMKELEKIGLRASGPALEEAFPKMKVMEKDRPDAVHFKSELGALNLGFRKESIEVFNKYIKKINVDATAKLAFAADDRTIKERVTRPDPKLNDRSRDGERTGGMSDVLDRRVREGRETSRERGGR